MSYYTNYLIRNSAGEIVFINGNTACFAEFSSKPAIANIDGTFEVLLPSRIVSVSEPAVSIPAFVKFISKNVLKCSVKLQEKIGGIKLDHEERRQTDLSENCWVISFPIKKSEGEPENSIVLRRLKIALYLVRFLWEGNFHYAVKYFLLLKEEKKKNKSRVRDYSLLSYTYSVLPLCNVGCSFWSGHGVAKTFDFKIKLTDDFIKDQNWNYVASSAFGLVNCRGITPNSREQFLNFKEYIK